MAVFSGVLQTVDVWNGAAYISLGGVRNASFSTANDVGDKTTKDSDTIREFDGSAFLKGHTASFSGLANDSAGFTILLSTAKDTDDVSELFELTMANGDTFTGNFAVTSISMEGGNANEHVGFSAELVAVGSLSYVQA